MVSQAEKQQLQNLSMLDVAASLGMELKRESGNIYYWSEHDSLKINTHTNRFHWFSRDVGGDNMELVEAVRGVSFKEAVKFLQTGQFEPAAQVEIKPPEPFKYLLAPYEHAFEAGKELPHE